MNTIQLTCQGCSKIYDIDRTEEIPKTAITMGCNWCPDCGDNATEIYEEWYNDADDGEGKEPTSPNQLDAFPLYPDERNYEPEAVPHKMLITKD